jgi:hypothetical protein
VDTDVSEEHVASIRWCLPTSQHGVTAQRTNIDIFTSLTASDLIFEAFVQSFIAFKYAVLLQKRAQYSTSHTVKAVQHFKSAAIVRQYFSGVLLTPR